MKKDKIKLSNKQIELLNDTFEKEHNKIIDNSNILEYSNNEYNIFFSEDYLLKFLPKGGGIDCNYEITYNNRSIHIKNYYHIMSTNGFYTGYTPINIWLFWDKEKCQFSDFTLRVNNHTHILLEYLQDTYYYFLEEINRNIVEVLQ